nr:uncharacterized protein LOC127339687 [Lolium perenne]
MSGGTGQRVPEGARLGDLKPPMVKAVGGGAFSLLAVHGKGIGEGLEEEMARALVGIRVIVSLLSLILSLSLIRSLPLRVAGVLPAPLLSSSADHAGWRRDGVGCWASLYRVGLLALAIVVGVGVVVCASVAYGEMPLGLFRSVPPLGACMPSLLTFVELPRWEIHGGTAKVGDLKNKSDGQRWSSGCVAVIPLLAGRGGEGKWRSCSVSRSAKVRHGGGLGLPRSFLSRCYCVFLSLPTGRGGEGRRRCARFSADGMWEAIFLSRSKATPWPIQLPAMDSGESTSFARPFLRFAVAYYGCVEASGSVPASSHDGGVADLWLDGGEREGPDCVLSSLSEIFSANARDLYVYLHLMGSFIIFCTSSVLI